MSYPKTMMFYGKKHYYLISKKTKAEALKEAKWQQRKLGKSARLAHRMSETRKYAVYVRPKG